MTNQFLTASYGSLPSIGSDNARIFLAHVSALVEKCPLSLLSILLKRIQEGVAVWVEDIDHKLNEKDSAIFKTVCATFKNPLRLQARLTQIGISTLD
jgi:hypothetical protein